MSGFDAVDLFAGPGGWDTGAAMLGIRTVGIEKDRDACLTARAAGHTRVQRDLAALDPERWHDAGHGLIGSPPCQAWSKAGKRLGLKDQPRLFDHLDAVARAGEWINYTADGWHDERSPLVLEPLRWALNLWPDWIVLEQVPDVLPFWERLGETLRALGYRVWVGILDAEMYGVPQTRDRAILTASRIDRHAVTRPPATHHRYIPNAPRQSVDLFDDLMPWVSMADALGWNGAAYRLARGAGMNERHGERPDTSMDRPAPVITSKARTASWVFTNNDSRTAGGGKERFSRITEAPSPTVSGETVRVSVEEASCLQSFPDGYPWQGSRTSQYQQIGNAVPVLLAVAVLGHLLRIGGWQDICRQAFASSVAA